ncbi:CapA family protein [Roseovarius sp. MMSF_3281]|uniref:CapA family protein n=1 Tax=Roseovarius sp. MMSF_3281 TaxID=3046694 RepID=UPI00273FC456|nr:CapA family protein [Roseovarius sp. MMSF_3281]
MEQVPQAEKALSALLQQARAALTYAIRTPEDGIPLRVFFSMSDGRKRATVVHFSGADLAEIWCQLDAWRLQQSEPDPLLRWLRVDWVARTWDLNWDQCKLAIRSSKRNYFRYGLALAPEFTQAFLEQELNANAMLYLGNDTPYGGLNAKNFCIYGQKRFGDGFQLPESPSHPVKLFTTEAFLIQPDQPPVPLHGFAGDSEGRDTGRRKIARLDADTVESMVDQSSRFLAAQVDEKGQFTYGLHPCFDREIKSYNTLRHTSTIYAMLEAWEVTRDADLKAAIDRALHLLTSTLIRQYSLPNGEQVAYLQDVNNEIKLGGSAVCLLALVKYTELTRDERHLPLLEQLAQGIVHMQNAETGQLTHVLNADDLSVKEVFRIIYYDGEAAFGLMRLYGLTNDSRWLAAVEKAFDYFIAQDHWKIHDHWLSYCVNELTLYRPEERYFKFGLQNVTGHLDFVIERITTFPTLLELMMAAHKMIRRLEQSDMHRHLLKHLDRDKFYRALETRAQYLLNGFFWPEIAMYFRNPQRILGSFFIRHHSFRVRIDDVEHYLSGYVAYLKHYLHEAPRLSQSPASDTKALPGTDDRASDLPRPAEAVLAWGGSVNLGRRQHYRTAQLGYDQVLDIPEFKAADLSVVNLDCVVSTLGKQSVDKGERGPFYYRARPEMLNVLTASGIDAVAVANAHSGDYGAAALLQQKDILDALGIASAGSGQTRKEAFSPAICTAGDIRVALFSIDAAQHRFAAGKDTPGTAHIPLRNGPDWRKTMEPRIARAKADADIVLVAVHWGGGDAPEPDGNVSAICHALIEAGADAVLGSSGHRLRGIEIYKSRPILHGAGALLSDISTNWLRDGGLFRLGLGKTGINWIEFVPLGIGYGFSQALKGDAAQELTERYRDMCQTMGTSLQRHGRGAFIELAPADSAPETPSPALKSPDRYRLERLPSFAPDASHGQASFVPEDARIDPVTLHGLTLLGVRLTPRRITDRQMLWVETWWSSSKPIPENLRLSYKAVPRGAAEAAQWGQNTDHDPCDWMQPTSNWTSGRIYYDQYGLRPPPRERMAPAPLQLEIRVTGRTPNNECYLHPRLIPVQLAK